MQRSKAAIREVVRCGWAQGERYIRYHDEEWGVPVHDDGTLFEFLILEGAQAGLSWSTILNKRENYRYAFDGFDPLQDREISAEEDQGAACRSRDRSQQIENRLGHCKRKGVSCRPGRIRHVSTATSGNSWDGKSRL